jgi:hypothetical protein
MVQRVMKSVTRKGTLIEEQGLPYLADHDGEPVI